MPKLLQRDLTSEREFWQNLGPVPEQELLAMKNFVQAWIERFHSIPANPRILEIGGAGAPTIVFFSNAARYAIDPLMDYYQTKFPNFYDGSSIVTAQAAADATPFENDFFDVVIMLNVIDHTENPVDIIRECYRVLKPGGVMAMSVDTYPWYWKLVRTISPYFGHKYYLLHPQTFTNRGISRILSKCNLKILHTFIDNRKISESGIIKYLRMMNYGMTRLYNLTEKEAR